MATQLDITNKALIFLDRLPITAIDNDQNAQLLFNQVGYLKPILSQRTDWNFMMVYISDNNPTTTNFSPDYVYTYQLPFNFGRLDRFSQNQVYMGAWRILDGLLLSNTKPVQYYYVLNDADYSILTPLFQRTLALNAAADLCMTITNDLEMTAYLKKEYEDTLADAIQQNRMEQQIVTLPGNSFNRITYV